MHHLYRYFSNYKKEHSTNNIDINNEHFCSCSTFDDKQTYSWKACAISLLPIKLSIKFTQSQVRTTTMREVSVAEILVRSRNFSYFHSFCPIYELENVSVPLGKWSGMKGRSHLWNTCWVSNNERESRAKTKRNT